MIGQKKYNLVHVTAAGEFMAPLVASQLFDQAECQAVDKTGFAPLKVEAWIIGNLRDYFDKTALEKIKSLRKRCPHITIRMLNGSSSMGKFPIAELARLFRYRLNPNIPVIYHCRGIPAADWGMKFRPFSKADKVIHDVRGYWPAEMLYNRGIEDPYIATGNDKLDFERANKDLLATIVGADAVTTVSPALRNLLIEQFRAPKDTSVVPCCINSLAEDSRRAEIRKDWGLQDGELAIVYSGTTAGYQHLHDLTVPFMKQLAATNPKVRLVFLTPELEKVRAILGNAGILIASVILKSFPQKEVASALTACDAGILIRKPTLVNRVANPVKIAEYLGAGLPIIIAKNIGGVADVMFEKSLLTGIEIFEGQDMGEEVNKVNLWLHDNFAAKRQQVREYAEQNYLWKSAINVSRAMYEKALQK